MWQRCFWLMVVLVWGHTTQGQTVFRQAFGDTLCYDEGYSIVPNASGYLVSTAQLCNSGWQAGLLQLNANGDSIGFTSPVPYNGYIRTLNSGDYIFLGGNRAGLAYDTMLIVKVTPQLDTVWSTPLFIPICNNQVYDLIEVADGYVLTGIFSETICSGGNASYQSFAAKLDTDGEVLWQRSYGGASDDELFTVRERPNGDLWYYGWNRNSGTTVPWLLVTNANGDSLTTYIGNNAGDIFGYGFDLTTDGGFITLDYGDSIYARKFDSSFTLEWQRSLGIPSGGQYFRAFQMLDLNYGFLACLDGMTGCNSHLFKLDRYGNIVWGKNWNGLLRTVTEAAPGEFLLTGYTNAFPLLPQTLVVGFDTIFDSIPDGIFDDYFEVNLTVYPNPTQGQININCALTINSVALVALDGRLLYQEQVASGKQFAIQLPTCPQGLYLLRLETMEGQALFRKLQVGN